MFAGPYTGYVVKIRVDDKARTVAITYTYGSSDEFDGTNANLSLTREGDDESKAAAATAGPQNVGSDLSSRPDASEDGMVWLNERVERNAQWSSLDWFEKDRVEITKAISDKLVIPLKEFDGVA